MSELPTILVTNGWKTDRNRKLTEVVIPSTVKTLNAPTKVTFMGTTLNVVPSTAAALQEFEANNITVISTSLFKSYTELSSITLNHLGSIVIPRTGNSGAFWGCSKLVAISMPLLASIDDYSGGGNTGTFRGCISLTTISFPSLTSNTNHSQTGGTFYGCTSLSSVSLPELRTVETGMGGMFMGCTGLSVIAFPKINRITSTSSEGGTFNGCTNLQEVTLGSEGNPVQAIGSYTFKSCTQSNLTITIYTTGGASLSGEPWGATNATIVYETA